MQGAGTLIRVTASGKSFSLSAADCRFLRDLAVVQLISIDLAGHYHYASLKAGATRPLSRLEAGGILTSSRFYAAGEKPTHVYQFATRAIAAAWGGGLPVIGTKRTALHEMMTTRGYFALGRPADFRVAGRLSGGDIFQCGSRQPDAIYTDAANGELVLVEADSGHYTARQIREKVARWSILGLSRQVWIQPLHSGAARVPDVAGVQVLRL